MPAKPLKSIKASQLLVEPIKPGKKTMSKVEFSLPATLVWARGLLLFFAATLPLYFDIAVPEVSGDIRWAATSFFAGVVALLLLAGGLQGFRPHDTLTFPPHGPLLLWVALGLALWAAISMIDAINPLRGIILLKALYAQLLLLLCVWWVAGQLAATPVSITRFCRGLMWALAAPLSITAFIGILQFYGFTQASFNEALSGTIWVVFKPFFAVLGWLLSVLFGSWVPGWPQSTELVTQLTGFFLQSAVPGGSFANKNLAGSYTAMMIPLMLYLFLSARGWWERGLASALLTLGLMFLVYARARASWLALMAALLLLGVLIAATPTLRAYIKASFSKAMLVWLVLPVGVVGYYGSNTSPVQGAYAIDRTPAEQLAALGSAAGGWNEYGGRLAYNLNSLVITRDYWFNGVGLGNFFTIYPPYYNALVTTPNNSYNVMARPQRTHTDLMQAYTEMGVPGGTFYALLFAVALAMGFRLAGPVAGRLAGCLVGVGLFGGLLMLTLFLAHKGLVQLPGVWHSIFALGLSAVVGWFGYRAVRLVVALNSGKASPAPLAEWQVAGLFGTIGLLTITLNALLDFPMQLPTAPAAAALLMGLLLALHGLLYPTAWRFGWAKAKAVLPARKLLLGTMAVLALCWGWALYDAYKFRVANTLLKIGMIRVFSGVLDDTTWHVLHRANEIYALDPRIHENMGVLYANYRGTLPLTLEERIAGLEWVLKGDPWGANHIVNLAGMYTQQINTARMAGNEALAQATLPKLHEMAQRLMKTADFSHFSWSVLGIYKLLNGQPAEAIPLLQRGLTINPSYEPAQFALQAAISLTGVQPMVVQDEALRALQPPSPGTP